MEDSEPLPLNLTWGPPVWGKVKVPFRFARWRLRLRRRIASWHRVLEGGQFWIGLTDWLQDLAVSLGIEVEMEVQVEVQRAKLTPPSIEQLIAWENEGGCETACEHAVWVEADGRCPECGLLVACAGLDLEF